MWSVLVETARILSESAPYLLLGFALAGLLHWLVGRNPRFAEALSTRGSKAVFLAALFGLPMPLCSCSVLPAGLALHKKGASKGATVSFLISVPETDVVSVLITYGLLGPVMAFFRPFAALVTAIVAGLAVNLVDRWFPAAEAPPAPMPGEGGPDNCCADCRPPPARAWRAIWRYGFVEFFDDILGALLLGMILGGLITALVPTLGLARFAGQSLLSMLVMLLVGVPMYVCASASTPIAVGLIAAGVSPGAALVFLLAGPATNLASLLVLGKHLGRPVLAVYLGCIALVSIVMGVWLDAFLASSSLPVTVPGYETAESSFTPVKIGGAVLLTILSLASFRRKQVLDRWVQRLRRRTGLPLSTRVVKAAAAIAAAGAYVGSGFFVVNPGERAVVTRFGRITHAYLGPGGHYHWPWPMGRADVEAVARVRLMELGFRRGADRLTSAAATAHEREMKAESWMLTGHEDICDIKWVVQYQVQDSEAGLLDYLYGAAKREQLVRDAAEAAIRAVVGCRSMDTLLTSGRGAVEEAVKNEWLQPALDRCRSGIRVLGVNLVDAHAPPEVHEAFREVASAAEEKMETIHLAYEYQERSACQARGEAARRVLEAQARACDVTRRAAGESAGFLEYWEAYGGAPAVTRLRMYFETVDAVLADLRKYIHVPSASGAGLDLWMIRRSTQRALPFLPSGAPFGDGLPGVGQFGRPSGAGPAGEGEPAGGVSQERAPAGGGTPP